MSKLIADLARPIADLNAAFHRHGLGELVALEVRGLQLQRIQAAAHADGSVHAEKLTTSRSICGVVLKPESRR